MTSIWFWVLVCIVCPIASVLPIAIGVYLSEREAISFWKRHRGLAELYKKLGM
jgi:hypothetical protein